MDTPAHKEVGDALTINLYNNPYLSMNPDGVYLINIQTLSDDHLPHPVDNLWLTPGDLVCSPDYFSDKNWDMELNLPSCRSLRNIEEVRQTLLHTAPCDKEKQALLKSYLTLASPQVASSDIKRILKITTAKYIPFSNTLNEYVQLIMLTLRVKNYGELLNLNQTHFTPWSDRVYLLGHNLALQYARFSWYLKGLAEDRNFQAPDPACETLYQELLKQGVIANTYEAGEKLLDLSYRFHALSLGIELYTFHYFSDHFAAGHMSQVGDLRKELPRKFGIWGKILANNIHNELNNVGVLTKRPNDTAPDANRYPIPATGDGTFDASHNICNKNACREGMQASLSDLEHTLRTGYVPDPEHYAGLKFLPDTDYRYRLVQPLFVMHEGSIYSRKNLGEIRVLSPEDYDAMLADPVSHGYEEMKHKRQAFWLVVLLRLLPCVYTGKVQEIAPDYLQQIIAQEPPLLADNPEIPSPPYAGVRPAPFPPCDPAAPRQFGFFASNGSMDIPLSEERLGHGSTP